MTDTTNPQLYLVGPSHFDLSEFSVALAGVLDSRDVACLRLILPSDDVSAAQRAADQLRAIAHERDVAVVVSDQLGLVEPHGLDGVHLTDGHHRLRHARETLGAERIVGCYCGASRHTGLTAGEIGADYCAFGPVAPDASGAEVAEQELFEWWGQMIEVPCVVEGAASAADVDRLQKHVEFFALGGAIWTDPDGPVKALDRLLPPA